MSANALRTAVVCGSRNGIDYLPGERAMSQALHRWRLEHVVVGSLRGTDLMAHSWASVRAGLVATVVPAQWEEHGKAAGPIRNRRMLRVFEPQVVLAFPGGRGTEDCVQAAREAGIEVARWVPAGERWMVQP